MLNTQHNIGITKYIIQYIKIFKLNLTGQFLITIFAAVNISLNPYLVKLILDKIVDLEPSQVMYSLLPIVCLYIFISFIGELAWRTFGWLVTNLRHQLRADITVDSMHKLMKQSHSFYQNNFAGSLANKINDISNSVHEITYISINRFFFNCLSLIIAMYTVSQIQLRFAILLLVWVTIITAVSYLISKIFIEYSDHTSEMKSKNVGQMVDILSNIMSVRLFTARRHESQNLKHVLNKYVESAKKRDYLFIKFESFLSFTFFIMQALCLWWLVCGVAAATITAGDFALILNINHGISTAIWNITYDMRNFGESLGSLNQGLRIINAPLKIMDTPSASKLVVIDGAINISNIDFVYDNSTNLFTNLSLAIKPKQKVGLVGFSGSGKTTLVNLILRLYNINSGIINIDNQNIASVSQDSLRQAISIIPQDSALFHRTLMDNIRYGRNDATDAEVIDAARAADAHQFIMQQPHGYQSLVGERGVKLSGGQRQRIAIARAILKNAPILILDEATSALDSVTEHKIQESIDSLMHDKTTLIIAHRLSTLLQMDRIIVFDEGQIVEDGSHAELLQNDRLYKILWDAQIGGFLPEKRL